MTGNEFLRRVRRFGREREESRMTQTLAWPVDLQRQDDGAILVSFPDIPEALTEGATEADALTQARDCLIDLDHRSHIGQIETALHALGKRLMVATQAA